jgi:hypothetical protein
MLCNGADMNLTDEKRAELTELLNQSKRRAPLANRVPQQPKQASPEDARKLAQLRMTYDQKESLLSAVKMAGR